MEKPEKQAQKARNGCYQVLEMPLGPYNGIRMQLAELKRFCKQEKLPLFVLKVEETIDHGVSFPMARPYQKYFTVVHQWCFYAAVPTKVEIIGEKGDGTVVIT